MERKARIDEFRRSEIEEHLKQKRDRVVQIEKDKAELLKKRKEASINAKRTRDKVVLMMDKIRLTKRWDDAKKIVNVNTEEKKKKKKKKSNKSKKHMEKMTEKLPQLERQHKKAVRMVASMKKETASSPSHHVEKTRKNDSDSNNAAMDFMSPYDVPQTVYVTQPHGGSKKKKKRGKKKKGKKSLASSSLLDSLAEF